MVICKYKCENRFFILKDFMVVHNGILTNYKEIKDYLMKKDYKFESETDTEVIAKLIQHIYERHKNFNFRELVETTVQQLVSERCILFYCSFKI